MSATAAVKLSDAEIRRQAAQAGVRDLRDPRHPGLRFRFDQSRQGGTWFLVARRKWNRLARFPEYSLAAILAELPTLRQRLCKGRAVVEGVFYELVCIDCNGSGWVVEGSRLVLSLEELVTQLSFKLQHAQRQIDALKGPVKVVGSQQQYLEPNRLGAGGINYTGD